MKSQTNSNLPVKSQTNVYVKMACDALFSDKTNPHKKNIGYTFVSEFTNIKNFFHGNIVWFRDHWP